MFESWKSIAKMRTNTGIAEYVLCLFEERLSELENSGSNIMTIQDVFTLLEECYSEARQTAVEGNLTVDHLNQRLTRLRRGNK